ncbi:ROK family protein [Asticcacaulis sp. 201]|uniref:ROK family protein n=1 Tax=Asticcacaulis sp. 201 TaxID=3028787 RepID=UPI002915E6F6|nr:ROK family protein [Asticcacaulis sp. 201]MDV6330656.1 ROK family protein [Asticcacaulis sp. 201]
MKRFIGIEMGGTKVVLAHGSGPEDLSVPIRVPTGHPDETLSAVIDSVHALMAQHGPVAGIGIASFGPIRVNKADARYGSFGLTPKAGYSHYNLLAPISAAFPDLPIAFDTDVNGAALGEGAFGGAQGLDSFAYVTVGTGIGLGLIMNGRPAHGLLHPEAGHILVRRDPVRDPFTGCCPFHGDCLEGLASGPAVEQRTGKRGEHLPDTDPVWGLVGNYLAQLFHSVTLVASPQRVIIGGSVGLKPAVLAQARTTLHASLAGYIEALSTMESIDSYVVPAALGDRAGVLGAIALAASA